MTENATLDCSDIDRYLGKPIQPARLKEPLANNDIRRWVRPCIIRTACTMRTNSRPQAVTVGLWRRYRSGSHR